jgi:hypothetical protein
MDTDPKAGMRCSADPAFFFCEEKRLAPDASWSHRRRRDRGGRPRWGRHADHHVRAALPDEYQDGGSAGSLVKARRHWLDLVSADVLPLPQRFTFVFRSPTERMALGLMDFLRYTDYTGFVRTADRDGVPQGDPWQVVGTSRATVWSLPSLEHLFMDLRGAGSRYESQLLTLDLVIQNGGTVGW